MRYSFHLVSRPTETVSIAEKHTRLIAGLAQIAGPWGLDSTKHPAPDPGSDITAYFSLGKHLRGRGVRGFISYRFRAGLTERSGDDDIIDLGFNPERVDFGGLLGALPVFIEAFDPYAAYVADEEFGFLDFERSRNVNLRTSVLRVYPICFLGSRLCEIALGLSATEVAKRFAAKVESVMEVGGGILLIGHTRPIPFATAKFLSDELSAAVGVSVSI